LIKGDITLSSAVDLTRIVGLELMGIGFTLGTKITIATNDIAFDLTDSAYISIKNIYFKIDPVYTPAAVFLLARDTDSRSSGNHQFINCYLSGETTSALIYNYSSENNYYQSCTFASDNRAFTITRNNIDGLTSAFQTIAVGLIAGSIHVYHECDFRKLSTGATESLLLDSCTHTIFIACYFGYRDGQYAVKFSFGGGTTTSTIFRDSDFESFICTADNQGAAQSLMFLTIEDCRTPLNAGLLIDLDKTNLTVDGCKINEFKSGFNGTPTMEFMTLTNANVELKGYAGWGSQLVVSTALTQSMVKVIAAANLNIGAATLTRTTISFYTTSGGTNNRGTATIVAAGTSIVVAHGCVYTPDAADINVGLTNQPTNDIGDVWISTIGAANFTINCRNVPGVATAIFSWAVRRVP